MTMNLGSVTDVCVIKLGFLFILIMSSDYHYEPPRDGIINNIIIIIMMDHFMGEAQIATRGVYYY